MEVVVDGGLVNAAAARLRLRLRRLDAFLFRVCGDLLRLGQLLLSCWICCRSSHEPAPPPGSSAAALHLLAHLLHRFLQGVEIGVAHLAATRAGQAMPMRAARDHQSKHPAVCFHGLFHSWFKVVDGWLNDRCCPGGIAGSILPARTGMFARTCMWSMMVFHCAAVRSVG